MQPSVHNYRPRTGHRPGDPAVSSEIAASKSQRGALEHAEPVTGSPASALARSGAAVARLWTSMPLALRCAAIALLGVFAATAVGLLTAENPAALPAGLAIELRVVMIVALIATGLYAQTSRIQARMGGLLIAVGLVSALWLLNGSSNRVLFSVGVVFTGLMPLVFAYLMLAHPTGHLHSRERAAVPVAHRRRFGDVVAAQHRDDAAASAQDPAAPVRSALPEQRVLDRLRHRSRHRDSGGDGAGVARRHVRNPGAARAQGATRVGPRAPLAHSGLADGVGRRGPADGEHAVSRVRAPRLDRARLDVHRPRGRAPDRDPDRARERTAVHGAGAR